MLLTVVLLLGCFLWISGSLTTLVSASDSSVIIFICTAMLSAARQISSVLANVSLGSLNNRSLTLSSRIPNMRRSRSISSGVISRNSQLSASFRNVVRYCSYDSPSSWARLLKRYLSNGTLFLGSQ